MITHLEPDILECDVKWALGSITANKANGGDEIPVELFQILKDDAVNVLHSICHQICKSQQVATGLGKVSFCSSPKERQCQRMLQLLHNCTHLTCQQGNSQTSPIQAPCRQHFYKRTLYLTRTAILIAFYIQEAENLNNNFNYQYIECSHFSYCHV